MRLRFKSPYGVKSEKAKISRRWRSGNAPPLVCRDMFRKRHNAPSTPTLDAPVVNLLVSLSIWPDSTSQSAGFSEKKKEKKTEKD